MLYDVIIIGAGPAGITTGLYTKRGNVKTLIIYGEESNLKKANNIENYYGFEAGISGEKLYNIGIKQAQYMGIQTKKEEVIKIEIENETKYFKVITTNGIYLAKTIVLALGAKKNVTNIQGIKELEGKGVSYCAICDGFFYRNKNVAVLGSGKYALSETNDLINIAKKITILTNGEKKPEFRAENVEIITKPIKQIAGNNRTEKVIFKDNTELKTDGIFVAQGIASASDFARKIGIIITQQGNIKVNEKMETNVSGIYACGDCTRRITPNF